MNCPESMSKIEDPHRLDTFSEHIDAFIEMMADLVEFTQPAESSAVDDIWSLLNVARELERLHTMRSEFDNLLVNKLRSPAGIKAVGTGNTARFLVDQLGISPREALQRIKAAQLDGDLEPEESRENDNELAQARASNRAKATAARHEGLLPAELAAGLTAALRQLKAGGPLTAEAIKARVYAELGELNQKQLLDLARQLVAESNNAITKPDPFKDLRKRAFRISRPDEDGCIRIGGTLDTAASALLMKLLNAHNKQIRNRGGEEHRSWEQLNADSFSQILKDAAEHANHGPSGQRLGLASIVAVAKTSDFPLGPNAASRIFATNVGVDLNAAQLLRLGVTNDFLLALMDESTGLKPVNLQMLRGQRLASFAQRVAIQLLDGCCQHPGCDRPIDECDLHHILAFMLGGRTDIENLVALCRAHHAQNDDSRRMRNRGHMCDRTAKTNGRSGWVHIDGEGNRSGPRFNTGSTARKAAGYRPPSGPNKTAPGQKTRQKAPGRSSPTTRNECNYAH